MLRTDLPDHRRASEGELVVALRGRDPLALAEAYHRTIPAAHAAARRLLPTSAEVEALLRAVYGELWQQPPDAMPLEGWVRRRTFDLAVADLRERGAAPASPSLSALLPDLPRPEVRYLDAAERALAELPDGERRALLLAHDRGIPSFEQDAPEAGEGLVAALTALAGPDPGGDTASDSDCRDVAGLGDWVLGLLPAERAEELAQTATTRPDCASQVKALRRGRRRLEGLPPTPDMGQRVLVVVLAGAPGDSSEDGTTAAALAAATPAVSDPALPSALDADSPGRLRPASEEDTGDLAADATTPGDVDDDGAGTSAGTSGTDVVDGDGDGRGEQGTVAASSPAPGTSGDPTDSESARRGDDPDATAAYAALADLDDPSPVTTAPPPPVPAASGNTRVADDRADAGSEGARRHDGVDGSQDPLDDDPDRDDDMDAGYDEDAPGRSGGRRLLRGLLFVLFLAAGIALGLFIGVRYLPQLLDRLS